MNSSRLRKWLSSSPTGSTPQRCLQLRIPRRATEIASGQSPSGLSAFLSELGEEQTEISARFDAWLDIPDSLFGSAEVRAQFWSDAVEAGASRLFVTQRGRGDQALFEMLVHPFFRGDARARQVLQAWAAPFRSSIQGSSFARAPDENVEEVSRGRRRLAERSGHETYRRVKKQKDEIKRLLLAGDADRAELFIDQLVDEQRPE